MKTDANKNSIVNTILKHKAEWLAKLGPKAQKEVHFGVVADFDGTLLGGDCIEGSAQFKGVRDLLETHLGSVSTWGPRAPLKWQELVECHFFHHREKDLTDKKRMALKKGIQKRARQMEAHYFPHMKELVAELAPHGIEMKILSLSPHFILEELIPYLGLAPDSLIQILEDQLPTYKGHRLSFDFKKHCLQKFLERELTEKKQRWIMLSGFGNCCSFDLPFMSYIEKEFEGTSWLVQPLEERGRLKPVAEA